MVYHYVMVVFEGRSPGFGHSLQVVVETHTGTGYGSDSPWEHPVSNALVSVMDLATFAALFLVVPYLFRPIAREALSRSVRTAVDQQDHVVVCGIPEYTEQLVEEFERRDAAYVVLAEQEEDVLAIRELDEAIPTTVVATDLEHERPLLHAGADEVLTPRHLLARRMANRVRTELDPTHSDAVALGNDRAILELTLFENSPLCGQTIADIERSIDERTRVVGLWTDGTFRGLPDGSAAAVRTTASWSWVRNRP